MQIDIKTTNVEPIRQTFAHVARRLGADKPASRYQEATLDVQSEANFHYRPLWDPQHELFDAERTAIKMEDWYAFRDPRQYYYGTWTITRARQQDSMERNFGFVEKRGLIDDLSDELRAKVAEAMLPLRHIDYAANLNNTYIAAYGYGTAVTQTASYASMDRLGIAQYLSRLGLLLDGQSGDSLDAAKKAWMEDSMWQPLRKLAENMLTIEDWFELYVAQAFVLDGLMFPLIYDRFDAQLSRAGAAAIPMLTEFMVDWDAEQNRVVNAFLKTASSESAENRAQLSQWAQQWAERCAEALRPLADHIFGEDGVTVIAELQQDLQQRGAKKCALDM